MHSCSNDSSHPEEFCHTLQRQVIQSTPLLLQEDPTNDQVHPVRVVTTGSKARFCEYEGGVCSLEHVPVVPQGHNHAGCRRQNMVD